MGSKCSEVVIATGGDSGYTKHENTTLGIQKELPQRECMHMLERGDKANSQTEFRLELLAVDL